MGKLTRTLAMLAAGGASGAAGSAMAAPAVTTVTLDIPIDTSTTDGSTWTPITLAGSSAPQFYLVTETQADENESSVGGGSSDTIAEAALIQADFATANSGYPVYGEPSAPSAIGIKSSTPGLPAAGEPFFKSTNAPEPYAFTYDYDVTAGADTLPSLEAQAAAVEATGNGTVKPNYVTGSPSDVYLHTEFSANGANYQGTFFFDTAGELESVSYVAVVPEPDAWALLIAGSALAGGALRAGRRRRTAIAA
jgi:hypothetical protein